MPFIDTKTNLRLTPEKEEILKARLGKAIEVFPGKNEYWLMLSFTDSSRMWFRGYSNFPMAMVEIKLFGSADDETCNRMTAEVCRIFHEELKINPEHIYVNYSFHNEWGWNGENF